MGTLTLRNVRKTFGKVEIIKDVSLECGHGEFMVFVGPSGSGKSTLLRMIAGLEGTTSGDILIDGKRVNDLAPVKRGISMVFQSYALYPHMSVFENIAFPLRVEKAAASEVTERVTKAARILKLEERLKYKPGELSGGQRQRVAIGRAIVRDPKIFLFDEPLSNLDAALRAEMRVELSSLHSQLGATMIYVTHDQVEAMTMADRIVVLDGGRISQVGSPLELYFKPINRFVAEFIGNPKMNMIEVTGVGQEPGGAVVALPNGAHVSVPVKLSGSIDGRKLTLGIRPEHVYRDGEGAGMDMTPFLAEHLGVHTVTYAEVPGCNGSFCAVMTGLPVSANTTITVRLRGSDCYLFDENGIAFERMIDMAELGYAAEQVAGRA